MVSKNNKHELVDSNSYFDGSKSKLMLIRILGVIITVLTLGICLPYVLCMTYKWKINHSVVDGVRLEFTGSASKIFGRWLKWWFLSIITIGIYSLWAQIKLEDWKLKNTKLKYSDEYKNKQQKEFDAAINEYKIEYEKEKQKEIDKAIKNGIDDYQIKAEELFNKKEKLFDEKERLMEIKMGQINHLKKEVEKYHKKIEEETSANSTEKRLFPVVGTRYHEGASILKRIVKDNGGVWDVGGESRHEISLTIKAEPDNKYDENAIIVISEHEGPEGARATRSGVIGYLPKNHGIRLTEPHQVKAVITEGFGEFKVIVEV